MNRKVRSGLKVIFGFAKYLAGFALLVALVLILKALFASRIQQPQTVSLSPSPIPPPVVSQSDPTAGWNVYEDKDLGFSVKFPNDWYYEENPDFQQPKTLPDTLETKVMFANFPPPFLGPAGSTPTGCRFDVIVASTEKDPRQLLKADQYKQIGALSSPTSGTSVTINGIEGMRRTYLPDKKAVQQTRTVVLLPGSNNLFALYFWKEGDETNTTCNDIFETMIQTFTLLK